MSRKGITYPLTIWWRRKIRDNIKILLVLDYFLSTGCYSTSNHLGHVWVRDSLSQVIGRKDSIHLSILHNCCCVKDTFREALVGKMEN